MALLCSATLVPRPSAFLSALALLALAGACSPKIGDACKVSTDCSIRGERTCDLSHRVDGDGFQQPNGSGECIIEGCTRGSCPKEAGCVVVHSTEFFSVACDPEREDVAVQCEKDCPADCSKVDAIWSCPPLDSCDVNEICLPEGVCADIVGARTSCRFECEDSSECREGYRCQKTGRNGLYAAPSVSKPLGTHEIKICSPDV